MAVCAFFLGWAIISAVAANWPAPLEGVPPKPAIPVPEINSGRDQISGWRPRRCDSRRLRLRLASSISLGISIDPEQAIGTVEDRRTPMPY